MSQMRIKGQQTCKRYGIMCYYKLGPEKKNKGIQVRQSGLRIASAKRGGVGEF